MARRRLDRWVDRLERFLFGDSPSPPTTAELLARYGAGEELAADAADAVVVERLALEERRMREIETNLRRAHVHLDLAARRRHTAGMRTK